MVSVPSTLHAPGIVGVQQLLLMECEHSLSKSLCPLSSLPWPLENLHTLRWTLVDLSPLTG